MARTVPALAILVVALVGSFAALQASGLFAALGVAPSPGAGVEKHVNQSEGKLRHYSATQQPNRVNFIGAILAGVGKAIHSFSVIFELPVILRNLGIPPWIVTYVMGPLVLLFGLYMVYMLTGRRQER